MRKLSVKDRAAVILNLFIGGMSFLSWIFMAVLIRDGDRLMANGLSSLKFFTVLSNLLNGSTCLAYAIWLLRGEEITRKKKVVRLVGTTEVGLTFVTVMIMLGPLYGYGNMFQGANLWMHLLLPLLSFASLLIMERGTRLAWKDTLWTLLPVAVYEVGYVMNIILNGVGTWPDTNDFYGFLTWGYAGGAVIAVLALLLTWLIAAVLWLSGGMKERKAEAR